MTSITVPNTLDVAFSIYPMLAKIKKPIPRESQDLLGWPVTYEAHRMLAELLGSAMGQVETQARLAFKAATTPPQWRSTVLLAGSGLIFSLCTIDDSDALSTGRPDEQLPALVNALFPAEAQELADKIMDVPVPGPLLVRTNDVVSLYSGKCGGVTLQWSEPMSILTPEGTAAFLEWQTWALALRK